MMELHKAFGGEHGLPEMMIVSQPSLKKGVAGYDMRKAIATEILGHEPLVEESGSMPFFKEVYKRARLESHGTATEAGMDFSKALTTTLSTYSAGTLPVLIPVYVDPEIVDLTRRATPLVELIPRVTNYGLYADYNQITEIATAQALPENGAEDEQDDSYTRQHIPMKYLYSIGKVTGPMFAASKQYLSSGGYVDALSLDVKNKTLALKRLEESMVLLGDSVTDWTEPVNSTTITAAYSYDGLWQLVSNANSNGHGGSSSYYTDLSASADTKISIGALRLGIRTARTSGGEPNLAVVDYRTYDDIKALIQDQLRYVSTQTIAWGITTVSFEGIPIIASRFLSVTAASGAATTPATASSIFILDMNVIEMRVLQDVSYEELAKTNDSIKYHLKCYEALVCKAPQFNHVLVGLA